MRSISTLLFSLIITTLFAQIPNGGFENWSNRSIEQVADWNAIGNVSKTTDAVSANFAVKLENKVANGTFGAITNANIATGITGGQPYTDIPLVMSFSCKFDLALGDVAKVLAIFKLQGQAIGSVDFTMNGSSSDTFETYNYAIQWGTSVSPDSLILIISSADVENTNIQGDGYLIIDHIEFHTFGNLKDSVYNHDFENWTELLVEHPTSWYTTDLYLQDQLNLPIKFDAVTKATHVQSGSGALKIKNVKPDADIIPGIVITGTSELGLEKPSFPVSERWGHIQGLYKYQPDQSDVATIAALLFKNGSLIGAAQLNITDSSDMDNYTYFSAPIQYFGAGIPDSASVIFTAADLENPVGENSCLWIDNVSFTNHTANIEKLNLKTISLMPNPATNYIELKNFKDVSNTYIIQSVDGAIIADGNQSRINIEGLSPGIYYITVLQENSLTQTLKFIKL